MKVLTCFRKSSAWAPSAASVSATYRITSSMDHLDESSAIFLTAGDADPPLDVGVDPPAGAFVGALAAALWAGVVAPEGVVGVGGPSMAGEMIFGESRPLLEAMLPSLELLREWPEDRQYSRSSLGLNHLHSPQQRWPVRAILVHHSSIPICTFMF